MNTGEYGFCAQHYEESDTDEWEESGEDDVSIHELSIRHSEQPKNDTDYEEKAEMGAEEEEDNGSSFVAVQSEEEVDIERSSGYELNGNSNSE